MPLECERCQSRATEGKLVTRPCEMQFASRGLFHHSGVLWVMPLECEWCQSRATEEKLVTRPWEMQFASRALFNHSGVLWVMPLECEWCSRERLRALRVNENPVANKCWSEFRHVTWMQLNAIYRLGTTDRTIFAARARVKILNLCCSNMFFGVFVKRL